MFSKSFNAIMLSGNTALKLLITEFVCPKITELDCRLLLKACVAIVPKVLFSSDEYEVVADTLQEPGVPGFGVKVGDVFVGVKFGLCLMPATEYVVGDA